MAKQKLGVEHSITLLLQQMGASDVESEIEPEDEDNEEDDEDEDDDDEQAEL